jgi:hypothetical protein
MKTLSQVSGYLEWFGSIQRPNQWLLEAVIPEVEEAVFWSLTPEILWG